MNKLVDSAELLNLEKESFIFKNDEPVKGLFIVINGTINEIYNRNEDSLKPSIFKPQTPKQQTNNTTFELKDKTKVNR